MADRLATVALLVRDYDEAIAWYTGALGFRLVHYTHQGGDKYWVVLGSRDGTGGHLLLAKAVGAEQNACVGDQFGGRVGFFLETDDFAVRHAAMVTFGVTFMEPPRDERYGTVAVFRDLYGNLWDLIEPRR